MDKLGLIKQRYNVNSVNELTVQQLRECAKSEDFVCDFSIELIQNGYYGEFPNESDVFKNLKKSIDKNVFLQIVYEEMEYVLGDDWTPKPHTQTGFYYYGINEDYDRVIDFN